jgi:uncharacterized membrane protein
LALSLGVNVFLGGFVAGRLLNNPQGMAPPESFRMREFGGPAADDPVIRDAFRKAFHQRKREFRDHFRESKALRKQFAETLGADDWNRAAAEAAAQRINEHERGRETAMLAVMVDVFDGLPGEKRKLLAAQMLKDATRRSEKHARGHIRSSGPDAPPEDETSSPTVEE